MNIVVCIKPVRSKFVNTELNPSNEWMMNPYDLYAFSCMLQLKKEMNHVHITCVSMGPLEAQCILTRCLAMGADRGILLADKCFSGSDTYATTYILSKAINKIGNYDLVICGKQAVDGETGQIPFGLAYRLGIGCFIQVEEVFQVKDNFLQFSRIVERYKEKIEVKLPVLLSFQKFIISSEINLMKLKKARNIPITIWDHNDINADTQCCGGSGSRTKVLDLKQSFEKKNSVFIEGDNREKAEKLLDIMNRGRMNG